jgi:cytochrome c biogenesis protein CcmG/thiol:disulfide interchange protein DsbE
MTRQVKLAGQGLAVALVAGLLALLVWKVVSGGPTSLKVGQTVPNFTLARIGAPGDLTLSSLRGRAVVLNFWASWCVPCKQEAPLLETAWNRWRSHGLTVVGVDSEDFTGDAAAFMRRYGMTYPNVHNGDGTVAKDRYGTTGYPESFVIDRHGKLVEHIAGQIAHESDLTPAIRKALTS